MVVARKKKGVSRRFSSLVSLVSLVLPARMPSSLVADDDADVARSCARRAVELALASRIHSPVVGFDTETTGLRGAVVQAALVELDGEGVETDVFVGLVHPPAGYVMEEGAVRTHGITSDRLRAEAQPAAPFFAELVRRIKRARERGVPVVAHNAAFDVARLNETLEKHGMASSRLQRGDVFCTMQAAKRPCGLVNRLGRPKAPSNAEMYAALFAGADASECGPLHDAASDARATARSYVEARRRGWWE